MGKMYYGKVVYKLRSKPKRDFAREVSGDIDDIVADLIVDYGEDLKAVYDEHSNVLWKD